jgi:membrane associated rhomboid family serine protease
VIPLKDDNITNATPILSYAIIAICVAVFLLQISSPGYTTGNLFYSYGVVPASLLGIEALPSDLEKIDPYLTIITSMFMHGGWMHLIGNMLYMWIFADNIEDDLGKTKFIIFYLAAGAAAALTQVYLNVNSTVPMVGASGAISGVLGAYLIRYPRNKVLVLIPLGIFTQLLKIPALFVLGFWFILQFISSAGSSSEGGGVAYGAHIGGFVFGAAVMFFFGNFLIPKKAFFKALNEKDGKKKNPWIEE